LAKVNLKLEGIKAAKERLWAGSGEVNHLAEKQAEPTSHEPKPLLAPNGKPSNLNAMQYAQVRTPEFKAWFGDFEQALQPDVPLVELTGNEIAGSTPKEARENAKAFIDKLIKTLIEETGTDTLHNQRTGFDIRLTQKGVVHGFQHQGAPHVKAVAAIRQLIENAAKIAEFPHKTATPRWENVYTLVAPLKIGEKHYAVKLTVKHDGKGGYRLYDHQALEMAKPDGIYEAHSSNATRESKNAGKLGYRPASGLHISVEQMLTAFNGDNQKYLASKVVDENGEPLVVYHGTSSQYNYNFINDAGDFIGQEDGVYLDNHDFTEFKNDRLNA